MKFLIAGADRETGQDRSIMIDASSEQEAIKSVGIILLIERVQDITPETIEYARPSSSNAGELPAEPTEPSPNMPSHWFLESFGSLFIGLGFLILVGALFAMGDRTFFTDRFQTANAIGATANAIERIASDSRSARQEEFALLIGALLIIWGMLILLLRALYRINFVLRHTPDN